MSYDEALEAMRHRTVQPAPFDGVQHKLEGRASLPGRGARVISAAAGVATLGFLALFVRPSFSAAPAWAQDVVRLQFAAVLPAVVLGWSLRRAHQPRLGSQLLCRAVWWSNLVVGLLVAINYGEMVDKAIGSVIAVSCAVALLASGDRGLDIREPDHPFSPVRFRGQLLLALVMAAADALTLAFSALMQLRFGMAGWNFGAALSYAGPTVLAAAVMAVAVWGVYRLRTWALLLNLVANIAIAYFAMEGSLNLSPSVSVTLASTAALQCFIPVPILAVALGDRNAGKPLLGRARRYLMTAAITTLAAFSVLAIPLPTRGGWVDGPGRAFVRGAVRTRPMPRSVRARRIAYGQDLRGWNFDGEMFVTDDFSGTDLRGASFRGASLQITAFDGADLRNADFRRADLMERWSPRRESLSKGVQIQGANFEGAAVSSETWAQIAANGTEGVTCPDGRPAAEDTGCAGRLGHLVDGYREVFLWDEDSPGDGRLCGKKGDPTVLFTDRSSGVLFLRYERFIRLSNGRFVSPDTTIEILADGRWKVSSDECGESFLVARDADASLPVPRRQ